MSLRRKFCYQNVCCSVNKKQFISFVHCNKAYIDGLVWHNRLGHSHSSILSKVLMHIDVSIDKDSIHDVFGSCKIAKSHRLSFFHIHER